MLRRCFGTMEAVSEIHKGYEKAASMQLRADQPVIVRLDGHRFSSFTKGFHKPYDMRLFRAMLLASSDLLAQYGCASVFTQSDEISMIFDVQNQEIGQTLPFNGKLQKLVSLAASFCSVRFCFHLERELGGTELLEAKRGLAHFDARAFNVPDAKAVAENLVWRQNDCKRNSVNNLGSLYLNNRMLFGRPPNVIRQLLEEGPGVSYSDMHPHYRLGALLKRQAFEKPFANPSTGESGTISRTRMSVLYRELQFDEGPLLLQGRADVAQPMFVPLVVAPAFCLQEKVRLILVCGSLPPSSRLLRHAAAVGVRVLWESEAGEEWSEVDSSAVVVAWDERVVKRAREKGARVVFVRQSVASCEDGVVAVPSLAWLIPERVGLPSFESHDEGLKLWDKNRATLRKT
jgi:tRNA(His) guanylyltransferase